MATYKKRGYKAKPVNEEGQGVSNEHSTTAEVFESLDITAGRTEEWVARNQRYILGGIGAIVLVVLGYLAYQQFILGPKETEAANEMFFAQQYFDEAVNSATNDSLYKVALNGAEGKYGLLDIIDNYGGTKSANLAYYSAGMSYLNIQQYDDAIAHLEKFKADDPILGALALGGIADAFVQIDQPKDAMSYYKRAIAYNDNGFTAPKFLFKAGTLAMQQGDYTEALKFFKRIKSEYPNAEEARTIDMFIGKAETLK